MNAGTAPPGMGRRITLLTDFGTADGYVAAMKGVIASIAPAAIIDDASHDIPPGDVRAASWALGAYWQLYPAGTVHVVVVDPGVGSARRALAIEIDRRIIIAPDNGVVSDVLRHTPLTRSVEIRNPAAARPDPSATFHGRDVFAPAAGQVAAGMGLEDLGPPADGQPVLLPEAKPVSDREGIIGSVAHVDRFGNLITDIPAEDSMVGHVDVQGRMLAPLRRTYADVERGEWVAIVGSRGFVEVSIRDGNAARVLGMGIGAQVVWQPSDLEPEIHKVPNRS